MDISDLENLLQITIPTDEKSQLVYEARLYAAVDLAKEHCKNDFLDADGNEVIPLGAQMGIALIVQAMGEKQNVQSQSLGDMSKSFFEGGTFKAATLYLKPYRKVSFK